MKKIKRVFKYLIYLLLSLMTLLSLYSIIATKVMHKEYANIFGYTYFIVASGSMADTIQVNDIIIVDLKGTYKENDIITFKKGDSFITHRIVRIEGDKVITKGDANNSNDDAISKSNIIGTVSLIIPTTFLFKNILIIVFAVIVYLIINFDEIFIKRLAKEKEVAKKRKLNKETPLDHTQTISVEAINELLKKDGECEKINFFENDLDVSEKKFVDLVLEVLQSKKKPLKLTTEDSLKLQYLYTVAVTDLYDPDAVADLFVDIPFEELYDYDFEEILFSKNIQDKLYEMPIHVFFRLLEESLIYNEAEFFDAVLKILKYRVRIDKDKDFICDNRAVDSVVQSIETLVDNLESGSNFDLKSIKERVKANAEIKKIETLEMPMLKNDK